MNENSGLSSNTRKALSVQLGESAANEIANLLERLTKQVEELKKSKVSVTEVVPGRTEKDPLDAIESESF